MPGIFIPPDVKYTLERDIHFHKIYTNASTVRFLKKQIVISINDEHDHFFNSIILNHTEKMIVYLSLLKLKLLQQNGTLSCYNNPKHDLKIHKHAIKSFFVL